jgi:hypothetical protein
MALVVVELQRSSGGSHYGTSETFHDLPSIRMRRKVPANIFSHGLISFQNLFIQWMSKDRAKRIAGVRTSLMT